MPGSARSGPTVRRVRSFATQSRPPSSDLDSSEGLGLQEVHSAGALIMPVHRAQAHTSESGARALPLEAGNLGPSAGPLVRMSPGLIAPQGGGP